MTPATVLDAVAAAYGVPVAAVHLVPPAPDGTPPRAAACVHRDGLTVRAVVVPLSPDYLAGEELAEVAHGRCPRCGRVFCSRPTPTTG